MFKNKSMLAKSLFAFCVMTQFAVVFVVDNVIKEYPLNISVLSLYEGSIEPALVKQFTFFSDYFNRDVLFVKFFSFALFYGAVIYFLSAKKKGQYRALTIMLVLNFFSFHSVFAIQDTFERLNASKEDSFFYGYYYPSNDLDCGITSIDKIDGLEILDYTVFAFDSKICGIGSIVKVPHEYLIGFNVEVIRSNGEKVMIDLKMPRSLEFQLVNSLSSIN